MISFQLAIQSRGNSFPLVIILVGQALGRSVSLSGWRSSLFLYHGHLRCSMFSKNIVSGQFVTQGMTDHRWSLVTCSDNPAGQHPQLLERLLPSCVSNWLSWRKGWSLVLTLRSVLTGPEISNANWGQKNDTNEKCNAVGRYKNWRMHVSSKGSNFKNFKHKMCRPNKTYLVLIQGVSRA